MVGNSDNSGQARKEGRGKISTPKTLLKWWKEFRHSAIFIYLNTCHGFSQLPPDVNGLSFADQLERMANNTRELRRFFGAYAYVAELIGASSRIVVPTHIERVVVETEKFSDLEKKTIAAYKDHHEFMADEKGLD